MLWTHEQNCRTTRTEHIQLRFPQSTELYNSKMHTYTQLKLTFNSPWCLREMVTSCSHSSRGKLRFSQPEKETHESLCFIFPCMWLAWTYQSWSIM